MAPPRLLLQVVLAVAFAASAVGADWPEPGGGSLNNNATSSFEPPRTEPVERWRAEFDVLLGEPVVAGGVVYVCGRRGKATRLHAFHVATGEEMTSVKIKTTGFGHVSVRGTTVVVVTPRTLYAFERRKDSLKRSKAIKGRFEAPAALLPGLAAVAGEGWMRVYDLRSGDQLYRARGLTIKPVIIEHDGGRAELFFPTPQMGPTPGGMLRVPLTRVGTRSPLVEAEPESTFNNAFSSRAQEPLILAMGPLAMGAVGRQQRLVVACERRVRVSGGGSMRFLFWPSTGGQSLPAITTSPVVWRDVLYGRTADGLLVQQPFGQLGRGLLPADSRPVGAKDGPITCAMGVLLLGNYALELETARVLWTLPDLEFDGPLIPAADGLVVYHDGFGALVAAGADRASIAGGASMPAFPPLLPGSGDAVVLVDGTRIPGAAVWGDDGSLHVTPLGADEAIDLAPERVCAIEAGGAIELVGEPYGLVLASQAALDLELAHGLSRVFASCAKRGLIAEATRLLDEIRERGLPLDDVRELEVKVAGKKETVAGNRDRQLAATRRDEERARTKALDRAISAARWLAEASLPLEASDVLARSVTIWPGDHPPPAAFDRLRPVATALIPAVFPWAGDAEAWKRWLIWAPEIAPAGGRFLCADELPDFGGARSIWRRRTIGLRTKNILLISRSDDPAIVGSCLRHGEASIRTLDDILDNPPTGDESPLEMRIHRTRTDFLSEDLGNGKKASPWSLGFYSPDLRVSRFHVPDSETSIHAGRALHEVVCHELTHQYIAERWRALGERRVRSPLMRNFWLVEGFARFIEDQSLEMGRRGQRLDDPTVQSVEAAAALAEQDRLLEFKPFYEASQLAFLKLSEDDAAKVSLRSTLVTVMYSVKSLYYEQAGALVFFLVNRCGDDGRARFLEILRDHYRGETKARSWTKLGFESAAALKAAYLAFLENPAAD